MEKMLNEINDVNQKMIKSFSTLKDIEEVEIATTPKTEIYAEDKLKLYHYDRETPASVKTPVLIVYALVNTYKMMDLQPDRSYIKNLMNLGLDVYLIDWGYPSKADKYLSIDDYVNGYINNCVDVVRKKHKTDKVNIISVCQGGTLSYNGLIPGEFLNEGFAQLKPMMKLQKQQSMASVMDDKDKLQNFLRMEKWIADSPAQAGECFRQFMKDLYQKNSLVNGELVVGGKKIKLKNITCPVLNIYATEDHLVPPAATKDLVNHIGSSEKETISFKGGHIGVFVGGKSQKELAPAVAEFLKKRDK